MQSIDSRVSMETLLSSLMCVRKLFGFYGQLSVKKSLFYRFVSYKTRCYKYSPSVYTSAVLPNVKEKVFFRKQVLFQKVNWLIISGKGYEKKPNIFYAVKFFCLSDI